MTDTLKNNCYAAYC